MVSLREMARADAERVPPAWLRPLLEAKFFEACPDHPGESLATRGGGCNLFCTVCTGRPLCHACVAGDHASHQIIQVRRSSKHNVVKAKDVEALLDIEEVQPYLINGELALFLNPRPQAGKGKAGENRCDDCDRALLHAAYRFCSLGCKLECMEWDLNISFAVRSETESESSEEDGTEETDDDGNDSSRPIGGTAHQDLGSLGGGNSGEEGGAAAAPHRATGQSFKPVEQSTKTSGPWPAGGN